MLILTDAVDGSQIILSAKKIESVSACEESTLVTMGSGSTWYVSEPVDSVHRLWAAGD